MVGVTTWSGDNLVIEDNTFEGMHVDSSAETGVFRRNVMCSGHVYARDGFDIVDNTFANDGRGVPAITLSNGQGSIRGNRISGPGIRVYAGAPKLRDNELTGPGTGTSVTCDPGAEALLKDNLITDYATPTAGCVQAGSNFTSP